MQRLHRNVLLIALGALLIPTPAAAGSRSDDTVLSGRVPLFLTRLEATEAALSIPGIHEVDNRLVVDPNLTPLPSHPTRP